MFVAYENIDVGKNVMQSDEDLAFYRTLFYSFCIKKECLLEWDYGTHCSLVT
jgi:hypothetical protein